MQQGSGRASPSNYGRRMRCSRGREAPRLRVWLSSLPLLYIGPQGGRRPWEIQSPKGAAARGGGVPPKASGAPPPHPRVSNPRCRGAKGGCTSPLGAGSPPTSAHVALRDRWPHPVDPRDPSDGPGTISGDPETFPMAETTLPIYNSSPPDHSETPRDIRDLIWVSKQHSVCCILIFIEP